MAEDFQSKSKHEDEGREFLENPTNRVMGAIALICLGILFLLGQYNVVSLTGNWWAIFIAIPAVLMLYNAYKAYQRDGSVTSDVRKNVSGGVMVGLVAIIAVLDRWGDLWPLFLIAFGLLLLVGFAGSRD